MKKISIWILALLVSLVGFSQEGIHVYPTNWWVGMKNRNLQVMVHSKDIASRIPMIKMPATGLAIAEGVTLTKVNRVENPNYIFLDLVISPAAKPGLRTFRFGSGDRAVDIPFELNIRRAGNGTTYAQGVRSEDFVYLLMPDRFSNGDPSNDRLSGYRDQSLNRDSMYHRHGGDLQGVINHLDYLKDLGVTTVWLTPILENDMPNRTEHGYAITDHYAVDRRHGGSEAYKKLSDAIHRNGMKLI
ncbi:MAG: alpha-amylase, partial [Flaviaesturariibacter sp.]|nr:alpha-amylase [Flaviaesturariibacter sp.]